MRNLTRNLKTVAVAGSLCLLAHGGMPSARSQDAPGKPAMADRDPAAMVLRAKMVQSYRGLHAYHEKVTQRQWKANQEEASVIEIELRYRKPNRLFLQVDYPQLGQAGRWQLVYACDGKNLTLYNSTKNEFQRIKAPSKLDTLRLPVSLRGPEFDALLRNIDPFEALDRSAIVRCSSAFEERGDRRLHILQMDIQQDGAKRVLRYRLNMKDYLIRGLSLAIQPKAELPNPFLEAETASRVEAEYTLVDSAPHFSEADFQYTPPAGASEKKSPDKEKKSPDEMKSPDADKRT